MSLRALGNTDASEALPWLWRIAAGLGLLLMLGNFVNRERPDRNENVRITVPDDTYLRDSATGTAHVPVVIKALDHNVMLAGCPEAPVLVLQLRAAGRWNTHREFNRPCNYRRATSIVRVFRNDSLITMLPVRVPGRYRVGLAAERREKVQWTPGDVFTVR